MKIAVGTKNKAKLKAVGDALRESPYFGDDITIEGFDVESGVADQPKSLDETLNGAIGRVNFMVNKDIKADFYIGLEGGVAQLKNTGMLFSFVAIGNGKDIHFANSPMISLPEYFHTELFENNGDLGDIARRLSGDNHITHKGGTYGELTDGMITRDIASKVAIHCALAPFFNKNYK